LSRIHPKLVCLSLIDLVSYEGESVNRSQTDIKRKTCGSRTWGKNIYSSTYPPLTLKHLSRRFTSASKPATLKFLTVVSATSAPGRASSETFNELERIS
jgi:hypothetical protein